MLKNSLLQREFLLFALVGSVGFVVDYLIVLALVQGLGLHPLAARVFAFIGAAASTWFLNRRLTFARRVSQGARASRFLPYLGMMLLGLAVNYATYAACLYFVFPLILPADLPKAFTLFLAVGFGSCAGLLINFISCNRILFKAD